MVIIERPCTYSKLAWCPTRYFTWHSYHNAFYNIFVRFSCIAALVKDSSVIRLFDVQQNEFGKLLVCQHLVVCRIASCQIDLMAVEDDMPPPVLERTVHC